MANGIYLGIDIGTFESKGVLVDRSGQVIASAASPHEMIVPQPGWAEHRAREDWWHDLTTISQQLINESDVSAKDIKAVSVSAIGPCMLPVDRDGEPLMNAVLYGVDGRSASEIEELTNIIGEDTLVAKCGNALTTQSIGPKILWLKRHRPDIFLATHKILTSSSFLVHQLTGEYVIDHYTAANFSPLYVVEEQRWSDELAPDIIPLDRLPRLLWSTEIAGRIHAEAAKATGLAEGTPVTAGTIDAAAEALSVGVISTGRMMLMYGSTIFTIMPTLERVSDPRLWYAPWLFEGQHASMAGLATSGTLTHWFRDQLAQELTRTDAFARLAGEAANSPPGANGLVFLPYFSGERTPIHDPLAKGCLFGLNLTHTRGDIYRALLEGIACATHHIIETYDEIGHSPAELLAVGGGTKNDVWTKATSDFTKLPQTLRKKTIGASYGDAFIAALAVGDVARSDIEHWNPVSTTVSPTTNEEEQAILANRYQIYRQIYENTQTQMHELNANPIT